MLDRMVAQQEFVINSDWASPMVTTSLNAIANSGLLQPGTTINNISLIGNTNFLKIKGDSVFGYLPYFGERRMSGNYGSNDIGISFEGLAEEFTVKKDSIKQEYQIYFEISDKKNSQESYQLRLTLFANLKSRLNVNSSHRTPINYSGIVEAIKVEED